jgi:DNA invertase Pin-like site-specific DNA recombinase
MLTVETIGRIRREHFLKGKTIKEIPRELKVSRNTVRKVLRSGVDPSGLRSDRGSYAFRIEGVPEPQQPLDSNDRHHGKPVAP